MDTKKTTNKESVQTEKTEAKVDTVKKADSKAKVDLPEATYSDSEIVMRTEAAEKKRNAVLLLLPWRIFKVIWHHDWNPGGRKEGDYLSLYTEICAIGINTNPIVSLRMAIAEVIELLKSPKNDPKVIKALWGLCGHLRTTCIIKAETDNPEAFKKHWADGVMVEIVQGLDPDQELYLAQDHDTVSRDKLTVVRQAIEQLGRGCSVRDVSLKLWSELEQNFSSVSDQCKAKIKAATTAKEKIKIMLDFRRGTVQNLFYLAVKLPDYCLKAYVRGLTGEEGDKLALADAVNLNTAQGKVGSKAIPTKTFLDLYASRTDSFDKINEGPKPLNAKQRKEFWGMLGSKVAEAFRLHLEGIKQLSFIDLDCELLTMEDEGTLVLPVLDIAAESLAIQKDIAQAS